MIARTPVPEPSSPVMAFVASLGGRLDAQLKSHKSSGDSSLSVR